MAALQLEGADAPSTSGSGGVLGRLYSYLHFSSSQTKEDASPTPAGKGEEDFSDLDMMGFLITGCKDRQGRPAALVVAKRYQAAVLQPERVLQYFIHRMQELVQQEYVLVWVHTQASYWENCPSARWLWQAYERLPPSFRTNLHRTYVVHCDLLLWLSLMAVGPWMTSSFYSKVEWVPRVEFLWEHISKEGVEVPDFVAEHDQLLEDQPLMDYGVVAAKDGPMHPGLPFPLVPT